MRGIIILKKKYVLIMCVLVVVFLALAGCHTSGKNEKASFQAIVLENNKTHLLVEPEKGSAEQNSADRIMVFIGEATLVDFQNRPISVDEIGTGDLIQIDYNGLIAESYPAQINKSFKVKVLQAAAERSVDNNNNFIKGISFKNGFYRPDPERVPEEIARCINYSREIPCVQEKMYSGYRFVLITEGRKPSGGYSVEVEEVVKQPDKLLIKVTTTVPEEKKAVDPVITTPFDLIVVEDNELPLEFIDVNDPDKYFMKLLGMETIDRPIVASSEWIKIFSPEPGKIIDTAFYVEGIASVFEGTVSYELLTADNNVLHKGYTTAAMGDWGYFKEKIPVPTNLEEGGLILQLYSVSAKDGSKMFTVDIPLFLMSC